jgi:prepilin-type N-terminal cleavage/methylation domain-containing protein
MKRKRTAGLTMVELLVVMAIVSVLMGVLTVFFRQQTQVTQQVQARNEVRTNLRSVAEIMVQDLQIAGSRAVFNGAKVEYLEPVSASYFVDEEVAVPPAEQCNAQTRNGCIRFGLDGADVSIYYGTSLRGASPCRRVDYLLRGDGLLLRRDVACNDTTTTFEGFEFAGNIDALNLTFICHDPDNEVGDIASCYNAGTYPRQATVTLQGRSERSRETAESTITLATNLPNLRPPVDYLELGN